MNDDPTTALRDSGLRVTRQRLAVVAALAAEPHAGADVVLQLVRREVGQVSTQAVYDVLNTLADRGLVRRIQPAGSAARYELRVGDNHHHAVCRRCGAVTDIDCSTGHAPCLEPSELDEHSPGFVVDEAEVTYWGLCAACDSSSRPALKAHDDLEERMPDDARPKAALFQKGARTEIGKRIEEAVHAGRSMDVARHQTEADPSEVAGNPSINQG